MSPPIARRAFLMLTIDSPIHGTRIAELLLPVSLRFSLDGKLQRGGWGSDAV